MISSQVSKAAQFAIWEKASKSLSLHFKQFKKRLEKLHFYRWNISFVSDVDIEASPRKKKRNAKDEKKTAKRRAEKLTNGNIIDEEVSSITINRYRFVIRNFRHFTHMLKGVMRTNGLYQFRPMASSPPPSLPPWTHPKLSISSSSGPAMD